MAAVRPKRLRKNTNGSTSGSADASGAGEPTANVALVSTTVPMRSKSSRLSMAPTSTGALESLIRSRPLRVRCDSTHHTHPGSACSSQAWIDPARPVSRSASEKKSCRSASLEIPSAAARSFLDKLPKTSPSVLATILGSDTRQGPSLSSPIASRTVLKNSSAARRQRSTASSKSFIE